MIAMKFLVDLKGGSSHLGGVKFDFQVLHDAISTRRNQWSIAHLDKINTHLNEM